ncbi:ABC-2 family transporter protein [uncultured Parvimonas sp.]|uniref:ABC-2 family transporter protein n=1 Tax=uncultured Parvimonas sp. TaxID=747372 RepID=UPI0025961C4C|nr:ABC-2 family transporter protein [uncultured Parvimonas sp.]
MIFLWESKKIENKIFNIIAFSKGKSRDILYVFLMQIIWIAVLFSIANFAFKIGVNKYESQGG